MRLVVRLLLTWLVAFALPLQGVSVSTLPACGGGHPQAVSDPLATGDSPGHTVALHVHGQAAAHDGHGHAGADHSFPSKAVLAGGEVHKCSACAACCSGAGAPTESILFDVTRLPEVFAPPVPQRLAAYVTEGLERPPRSFPA